MCVWGGVPLGVQKGSLEELKAGLPEILAQPSHQPPPAPSAPSPTGAPINTVLPPLFPAAT